MGRQRCTFDVLRIRYHFRHSNGIVVGNHSRSLWSFHNRTRRIGRRRGARESNSLARQCFCRSANHPQRCILDQDQTVSSQGHVCPLPLTGCRYPLYRTESPLLGRPQGENRTFSHPRHRCDPTTASWPGGLVSSGTRHRRNALVYL